MGRKMTKKKYTTYKDEKLAGQEIADLIVAEWHVGHYSTIAEVTTAVHRIRQDIPRSVIFWLAYHTIESTEVCGLPEPASAAWPPR